ncbi:hypothetical protein IHE44_0003224 [Lamprotornis superbus]|uniref:Uncharacterized protein n=1 Tax=Lamprotornis superbus TaxID=245042 RepID=A0A835NYK8_9PASS|nr:hypothetical protein IHE44_0003224 [Lamprotornis superbus]
MHAASTQCLYLEQTLEEKEGHESSCKGEELHILPPISPAHTLLGGLQDCWPTGQRLISSDVSKHLIPTGLQQEEPADLFSPSGHSPTNPAMPVVHLPKSLWLDGNNLTFLTPGTFHALSRLQELHLSRNSRLTYLHANTFRGLLNLISLDLSHCNIFEIHPLLFSHLPSLERLDLASNNMRYVPQAFKNLSNLTRLSLEGNHIEAIGRDSLKDLETLYDLNLRKNRIWIIQNGAFTKLLRLGMLNLGHNFITDLSNQLFEGLIQLKTMHLEANRITAVDCTFRQLLNLRNLYLNNNQISSISDSAFLYLNKLHFLHLSRNNLSSLPMHLFTKLPKLRLVLLSHNPWSCDCSTLWLWTSRRAAIEGLDCAFLHPPNSTAPGEPRPAPLGDCTVPLELASEDKCRVAGTSVAPRPPALPGQLILLALACHTWYSERGWGTVVATQEGNLHLEVLDGGGLASFFQGLVYPADYNVIIGFLTITQVLEDIQAQHPVTQQFISDKPPDANFVIDMAITFQKGPVDVLVFRLGKCRVLVEQVGNEGQVQFGVATDHISGCDELPAAEAIRLLQHVLCPAQLDVSEQADLDDLPEEPKDQLPEAACQRFLQCQCRGKAGRQAEQPLEEAVQPLEHGRLREKATKPTLEQECKAVCQCSLIARLPMSLPLCSLAKVTSQKQQSCQGTPWHRDNHESSRILLALLLITGSGKNEVVRDESDGQVWQPGKAAQTGRAGLCRELHHCGGCVHSPPHPPQPLLKAASTIVTIPKGLCKFQRRQDSPEQPPSGQLLTLSCWERQVPCYAYVHLGADCETLLQLLHNSPPLQGKNLPNPLGADTHIGPELEHDCVQSSERTHPGTLNPE